MAKNIFSTTLLLVAVVGCSEVDDRVEEDSLSINFETQSTRTLSSDLDAMEGDTDGIVVYGLVSGDDTWYDSLDGGRYTYDFASQRWGWGSDDAPSWPEPFSPMNFYAYHPSSAVGFTLSSLTPSTLVADIEVEASILDQTDFLASASGDVVVKPATGVQSLSFDHIMAKISFCVVQDEGVLTVIRQLGIENVISRGSYDYVNSRWEELSDENLGSFDDYVGSSGTFARWGVEGQLYPVRLDGHYLMLIPQQGGVDTPLWDGSVTLDEESGDLLLEGAYISIRYRTNSESEDIVGYEIRAGSTSETEWDESSEYYTDYKLSGGTYTGPLFVKAGFRFAPEQLSWEAGTEYDYALQLNQSGGIYLSEYYVDQYGQNTKIRIEGSPNVGDLVFATDMIFSITVNGWHYSDSTIYPK
ncbi:MAG: fimbrillin family protein [Rikenellaceae bacterium]